MGATTPDLLPWPENGDPAMVPQDMQELATATQTALTGIRTAARVPFTGMSRSSDVALTADTVHNITFQDTYTQPPNTVAAMTHTVSGWSRFGVVKAGLHTLELDVSVYSETAGKTSSFDIGVTDGTTGVSGTFTVVKSSRMQLHLTQHWTGAFYAYVKPLGATATDWKMLYARIVLAGG